MAAMLVFAVSAPAFAAANDTQTEEAAETLTEADAEAQTEAADAGDNGVKSSKAFAAAICVGAAAAAGTISMGLTTSKSAESMARQPEASGDIRSSMMLGFVFIETAIIYALIIGILIIFVL